MEETISQSTLLLLATYERMAKIQMPLEVIRQKISIDVQTNETDTKLDEIVNYLGLIREGYTPPKPDLSFLDSLLDTKYQRLEERGFDHHNVELMKGYDRFRLKTEERKQNNEQSEVKGVELAGYVSVYATSGAATLDMTVCGEGLQEISSKSYQRALEMKDESYAMAAERISVIMKELGAVDSLSLVGSKSLNRGGSSDDNTPNLPFHSPTLCFPQPEITNVTQISVPDYASGLHQDGPTRTVTVHEHISDHLWTFMNVLSPIDCKKIISELEFTEIEEAMQQKLLQQALDFDQAIFRTNIRRTYLDVNVANLVWHCVRNYVPAHLPDGRSFVGVRTKMFFYKYCEGQFFATHLDGGHRFSHTGETSEFTFVIYLNDDFSGGETRFCPLNQSTDQVTNSSTDTSTGTNTSTSTPHSTSRVAARDVKPSQGSMLIFSQRDMKHCGVTITKGSKYILQGMLMYGPLNYNKLGKPLGLPPMTFTQFHTC
eukprot:TRINITY_DN5140_c0_g1_i7.p1 TRINITY_DN5140_c0_g1~~TRINITY_DN5140_c0_g1_i7.p1  ORF type:complete len:487 (-),score=82.73 TRINITY_DN5140_c0_g1_i7:58-1518(-)